MKLLLIFALCLLGTLARAQRVEISPVIIDASMGDFVLIFAEQLPFHSVSVRVSPSLVPTDWSYEIAGYGCYNQRQWVVCSYPARRPWQPTAWFRSINTPCSIPFAPSGPTEALTPVEASLVFVLDNQRWRLEPLAKVSPPRLDGVKCFRLVPAESPNAAKV